MTPYIYSTTELQRLLKAAAFLASRKKPCQEEMLRTLILLLYGSAIRIGEALRLTLGDLNLNQGVLTIRDTKFFKTRLVPIGPRLKAVLTDYVHRWRHDVRGRQAPLFPSLGGGRFSRPRAERLFVALRKKAGVHRETSARYQPRLHDIRHTSAVHRLISWYESGANVQRLLPMLSVYLGHSDIRSTQQYLYMTPELLRQACRRFEKYAHLEANHGK
jgi:integrase